MGNESLTSCPCTNKELMSPLLLVVAPTPAPAPTPTPASALAPILSVSVFSTAALVRRPAAPLLTVPAVSLVTGVRRV